MSIQTFQNLLFEEKEDKIIVTFLKLFETEIPKKGVKVIDKNTIECGDRLFTRYLNQAFSNLKNKLSKNPTLYIHQNSNIPLIGSLAFGIVDKGSNMLEVKPLTSCNVDCIFCSVDEGPSSKKKLDIVIEKDYLVQELNKLLDFKKEKINIYFNPQGEPLLYADIIPLIEDISKNQYVDEIHIITNGMLLNEKLVDDLANAGLTHINLSLNSLNKEQGQKIANIKAYDVTKIANLAKKIKDKIKVIIAPVYMKGINEQDIDDLTAFCKENSLELGIQNYLFNKRGRKPVKEDSFDNFFEFLKKLETKHNFKMMQPEKMTKTKQYSTPFKKGDIVEVEMFHQGRYPNESLARAKDRIITISQPFVKRQFKKVKISRDKYNIFYA